MIEIRQMEIDDLEGVMEIERAAFSVPWTETGFFTFLIRDDTLFLTALSDGAVVGYCGVVMAADEGDITNVAVREDFRGQGIGTDLVSALIRETGKRGIRSLYLEVRESNRPAIALYASLGFVQNGRRKRYYEAPPEDALLMCRRDTEETV